MPSQSHIAISAFTPEQRLAEESEHDATTTEKSNSKPQIKAPQGKSKGLPHPQPHTIIPGGHDLVCSNPQN
ncbi:hypothetical protein Ssi02_49850 [Sinosporangium siamense]|uniref:Uncharacterized protein n=1 Tax=Sinosporangium siamense TaxID=1367973 RepID=A0A919RLR5_9ACTN|nr:hypothetical protein Ssi02_49850 [Sinosporangium siamense]